MMASKRQRLKRQVVEALQRGQLAEDRELNEFPPQELLNPLFNCLCHREQLVRWRAVDGFGLVVPKIADRNPEQARVVMRRFLWMLNDESGGIGWGVPEAMAAVMAGNDLLAEEYLHMLISYTLDDGAELLAHGNFLEHAQLQEGVLWGLCLLAPRYRERMVAGGVAANLSGYFGSPHSAVRGLVCRLCGLLALVSYQAQLTALHTDPAVLQIYENGRISEYRVQDLARQAVLMLVG